MEAVFNTANEKMQKTINVLKSEFAAIRAGRATAAVLDKILVDYYGTPTPINQMAAIAVSEARVLNIQPWDVSTLHAIEKAIQSSDLGINPQNDGRIIRLNFPALTEDKRRDIVRTVKKTAEDAKVAARAVRRDCIEKIKKMQKASEVTEDDLKDGEKQLQEITDKAVKEIDELAALKEKEVMEI